MFRQASRTVVSLSVRRRQAEGLQGTNVKLRQRPQTMMHTIQKHGPQPEVVFARHVESRLVTVNLVGSQTRIRAHTAPPVVDVVRRINGVCEAHDVPLLEARHVQHLSARSRHRHSTVSEQLRLDIRASKHRLNGSYSHTYAAFPPVDRGIAVFTGNQVLLSTAQRWRQRLPLPPNINKTSRLLQL